MAFPLQIHHKNTEPQCTRRKKPTLFAVIISLTQLVICFHVYYRTMRSVSQFKPPYSCSSPYTYVKYRCLYLNETRKNVEVHVQLSFYLFTLSLVIYGTTLPTFSLHFHQHYQNVREEKWSFLKAL